MTRLRRAVSIVAATSLCWLGVATGATPAHAAGDYAGSLTASRLTDANGDGKFGQGDTETLTIHYTVPAGAVAGRVSGEATGIRAQDVAVSPTCSAGSADGDAWSLAGVAAGTDVVCTVAFTAQAQPKATSATFSATINDSDANQTDSVTSAAVPAEYAPQVTVAKVADPNPVAPGRTISWGITFTNPTPYAAYVTFDDEAMTGYAYCYGDLWDCSAMPSDGSPRSLVLAPNGTAHVDYSSDATAADQPGADQPETNTVNYTLHDGDVSGPALGNGSASATVTKNLTALQELRAEATDHVFEGGTLNQGAFFYIDITRTTELRITDPAVIQSGGRLLCNAVEGVTYSGDAEVEPDQPAADPAGPIRCHGV